MFSFCFWKWQSTATPTWPNLRDFRLKQSGTWPLICQCELTPEQWSDNDLKMLDKPELESRVSGHCHSANLTEFTLGDSILKSSIWFTQYTLQKKKQSTIYSEKTVLHLPSDTLYPTVTATYLWKTRECLTSKYSFWHSFALWIIIIVILSKKKPYRVKVSPETFIHNCKYCR